MKSKRKKPSPVGDGRIERAVAAFDFLEAASRFRQRCFLWGYEPRTRLPSSYDLRLLAGHLLQALIDRPSEVEARCGGLLARRRDDGALELATDF